jgi:long-chain fatty acid transport protein
MTSNLSARIGKLGANIVATALTVTALTTNAVQAGGIERSNQSLAFLFEQGRLIELSFGRIAPELSGTDRASQQTGNVAQDFTQLGLSYKYDVNDQM